ncbi:late embryogenesis abundant protein At1g64065-like [Actinidia eriantha]|uniref:late embryogenesis abundant protein At1g64065-like n=1 Tax=Actinidia eriantha TaxID=165200 RepID=UPI0025872EAD|nr:late embryogenesis abundant protein At1g64065-like [Actinidia eriantha]
MADKNQKAYHLAAANGYSRNDAETGEAPKFRVRHSKSFDIFDVQPVTPSFNMRMNAQFGVKNTNFGPFKYGNTTVTFYYKGTEVGSTIVRKSKANFRSTKKVNVSADLVMPTTLASRVNLISDLNSEILPLTSQAKMNGKVEIIFIFKKKRTANMNCTMDVNISTKSLQNVKCK